MCVYPLAARHTDQSPPLYLVADFFACLHRCCCLVASPRGPACCSRLWLRAVSWPLVVRMANETINRERERELLDSEGLYLAAAVVVAGVRSTTLASMQHALSPVSLALEQRRTMAVPKKKTSHSRSGMRYNDSFKKLKLQHHAMTCTKCGQVRRRHRYVVARCDAYDLRDEACCSHRDGHGCTHARTHTASAKTGTAIIDWIPQRRCEDSVYSAAVFINHKPTSANQQPQPPRRRRHRSTIRTLTNSRGCCVQSLSLWCSWRVAFILMSDWRTWLHRHHHHQSRGTHERAPA